MPSYTRFTTLAKAKCAGRRPRPFETIPTEILMVIFEEYCHTARESEETTYFPELLLTRVCCYWRSVAVSLPTLWTKLAITSLVPSEVVRTYLERALHHPLDLEVDLQCDSFDHAEREHALDIWRLLLTRAPQWRRLVVQLGPDDAKVALDQLRNLDAPLLEDLQMTCTTHLTETTPLFERALPSLTSLRLAGISLHRFTTSLPQLTHLHLTSNIPIPFSIFQGLMNTMVELQDLTLRKRVVEGWPLYPLTEDTIQLPSLQSLKVSDRRSPVFVPLLSISAPVMKTLTLYDLTAHDLPQSFQETQICNNFPSISNLTLKGKSSFIDNGSFNQLSRVFPTIDHFSLLGVDEEFVRESSRAMHATNVWPKLQTISMIPVVEEDMLHSLISARTQPSAKTALKNVLVPIDTNFDNVGPVSQQLDDADSQLSPIFAFNDGSSRRCSIDLTAGGGSFFNRRQSISLSRFQV
ncbi:hypothetical protein CPC08DRAFT_299503 [Agrocybe pediades]|nr:hypothetical protein CPC08DRAFT_299503 [Agrocybe pediades]